MPEHEAISLAKPAGVALAVGVAVPALAFAASLPFDEVHEAVTPAMVPFVAGAAVGVGAFALGASRAARRADDEVADGTVADGERGGMRFSRRRDDLPSDVPVVPRAQDALSEEEAWNDIDSFFDTHTDISCDASRSKDIYQIALEELKRDATATGVTPADTSATTGHVAPFSAPLSQETASFFAAAGVAMPAPVKAAASDVTMPARSVPPVQEATQADADDEDRESARLEALASLDSFKPKVPAAAPGTASPAITSRATVGVVPAVASSGAMPEVPAALDLDFDLDEPDDEVEVPMADYSGHEDMWAQALEILAEPVRPVEPAVPAYQPRHMRAAGARAAATGSLRGVGDTDPTARTKPSTTGSYRMGREYLRVIQGGTSTSSFQQAEGQ